MCNACNYLKNRLEDAAAAVQRDRSSEVRIHCSLSELSEPTSARRLFLPLLLEAGTTGALPSKYSS